MQHPTLLNQDYESWIKESKNVWKQIRQTRQFVAEAAPELAAAILPTGSVDEWLPPDQIVKLLQHCINTGKAPDGFSLYSTGVAVGKPDAGTVIFQQQPLSETWRGCGRWDVHEWKRSGGVARGHQVRLQGKQLLRAQHIRHHADKSFRRSVYYLLDDATVRMVHYIHTDGARQPISSSSGLKRAVAAIGSVSSGQTSSEGETGCAAKRASVHPDIPTAVPAATPALVSLGGRLVKVGTVISS
jgi:hypothetical protein